MKSFHPFRLDTVNHILWREEDRIPITPRAFDVLVYLVEHAGQLVTQDEVFEALWADTYVNPEVIRKYILEVRKALGDRPDNPEFVETLPKRGYRFVAPVIDETTEPQEPSTPPPIEEQADFETVPLEQAPPSPRQHTPWKFAVIPVLMVMAWAAIAAYSRTSRHSATASTAKVTSIAVLPFEDMSPFKNKEYFSDGFSEQLINDLAKVSGLKVVGRSSAFQFKGKNEDLREIGRKLGVANVLEGSVSCNGDHVRITAELIKTDDGFQLWSQTYDRDTKDIFGVQNEIAQAATQALQLKLLGVDGQLVASSARSVNPAAYQAYLQAEYFSGRGESKEDLGKALDYANEAIKLDEKYAPVWALRAAVQDTMAETSLSDTTEGFRKTRDDAERAIALDPDLASAYLTLARTQIYYDWNWDAASTSIAKAAALEPGGVEILRVHSNLAFVMGNLKQAIKFYEQAVALDPLRANSRLILGNLLYEAGRYDEAHAQLQKALDLNPQAVFAHSLGSLILLAQGKPQLALAETEKESSKWARLNGEALIYHALGREQNSTAALAELIAKYGADSAYQVAQVYVYRGESDKSFEWLERAYKQRDPGLPEINSDPLFKSLHHDPRYTALLKRIGLPA